MVAIATLGSHCSLQVLKGAKDEGLKTILVCEKKREKLYRRFPFIDELIIVDSFKEILDQQCQSKLKESDAVLIPHGTLIAQMNSDEIESIKTPVFGNKWILRWESERVRKESSNCSFVVSLEYQQRSKFIWIKSRSPLLRLRRQQISSSHYLMWLGNECLQRVAQRTLSRSWRPSASLHTRIVLRRKQRLLDS